MLASLNLPAAIEDTSGTELPQSLLEKANYVREGGGKAILEASMKELPELLQRNQELLDEVNMKFYCNYFNDYLIAYQFYFYFRYSVNECFKKNVNPMIN